LLLSEEFPQFADSLHIVTSSQTQPPFCCINAFNDLSWQYHVSVAVAVSNPDDMLVLDPSLFTAPVPKEHWKKRINALTATAADYDEMILSLSPGDVCELNTCRNSLMNEVVNHGWPPYRACP
jgi:hypothetical protein